MEELLHFIENGIGRYDNAAIYAEDNFKIYVTHDSVLNFARTIGEIGCFQPQKNQVIAILSRECIHILPIVLSAIENKRSFIFLTFKNTVEYNVKLIDSIRPAFVFIMYKENRIVDLNYVELFNTELNFYHSLIINKFDQCDCQIKLYKTNFDDCSKLYTKLPQITYIIQTSGTTGAPKFVYVPYQSIVPNIWDIIRLFSISSKDVIMLASALTFDMGILEIFLSLFSKATLLIVPDVMKRLPIYLTSAIINNGVTILQATPSLLRLMFASASTLKDNFMAWNNMIGQLKILALGGELCPTLHELRVWVKDLRNKIQMESGCQKLRIFNFYGLTEQSCWSMYYEIPPKTLYDFDIEEDELRMGVPLGQPFSNTRVVLKKLKSHNLNFYQDDSFGIVDNLVYGELCVGPTVNNTHQTDDADDDDDTIWQIEGPHDGTMERRCYDSLLRPLPTLLRTGDVVCLKPGQPAQLYYSHRLRQNFDCCVVKRSGQRISTSAIEKFARSCPHIPAGSSVHLDLPEENGITRINLYVFVTPSLGASIDHHDLRLHLRAYLQTCLPHYSLPDRICVLSQSLLPLTSHGKLDRTKLADLLVERHEPEVLSLNDKLMREWLAHTSPRVGASVKSPLDRDPSPDENFLFSGGDSLSAIALSEQLSSWTNHVIEPWVFLEDLLYHNYGAVLDRLTHSRARTNKPNLPELKLPDNGFNEADGVAKRCRFASIPTTPPETALSVQGHSTYRFAHVSGGLRPFRLPSAILDFGEMAPAKRGTFTIRPVAKFDVGKCLDATPLVIADQSGASERIYLGCHSGWFYAFGSVQEEEGGGTNERECPVIWKTRLGGRIEASAAFSRQSNLVLIGCYDYHLYALGRGSGLVEWKFACGAEIKSTPAFDDDKDLAYFGCHDKRVYALDVASGGREVWRLECPDGASLFSSPTLNDSRTVLVFATLKGSVYGARTADGHVLWALASARGTALTAKPIFSSPCTLSSDLYALGGVDGNVYLVGPGARGQAEYKQTVLESGGPIFASLACFSPKGGPPSYLAGVSYDGNLYTMKITNEVRGEVQGANGGIKLQLQSVANLGHSDLYAAPRPFFIEKPEITEYDTLILVANKEGDLFLTEPETGDVVCKYSLKESTYSTPVISRSNIYIGTRENHFIQLKISWDPLD